MKHTRSAIAGILARGIGAAILLGTVIAAAATPQARLSASLATPVLLANQKQTAYLKVGLTGIPLPATHAPVNLAIVLDKSGSMQGEKIAKAREAAIMAIERLSPDDIVSVVVYDTTVHVLVPATKMSDREAVFARIRSIGAGGTTALFAGVSKGAEEVRKFLSRDRVNRIILLSDGQANVGPQAPSELARLGASLAREGIAVSTIGLGLDYNEDLMRQLAQNSDGSHFFAETAGSLALVFDEEFGRATAVVAQRARVVIECAAGVRPVRTLLRGSDIAGGKVTVDLNHLYGGQEKTVILELEAPAHEAGATVEMARVNVRYENMATGKSETLTDAVTARFTTSRAEVEARTDSTVMVDVVEKLAVERNELATALRDQGKIAEARDLLLMNAEYLKNNAARYQSPRLERYFSSNQSDAQNLEGENWVRQRKLQQVEQSSRY